MVPLLCLLLVVPFAAAGNEMDMMNQFMQQQMMTMMAQKGWGGNNNGGNMGGNNNGGNMGGGNQQQGGDWWSASNTEDYEAYMKWCQERQIAMKETEQQRMMLKQWEDSQNERKMEVEREKHVKEAAERHESMMAQWKMWQMRLSQQHEFDNLIGKFTEMKHGYMFAVTMEFLKFCKCSDFTDELQRYFMHGDMHYESGEDWDLDDLQGINSNNAQEVAQALANLPKSDQVKAFFGGLATSMCLGARTYVEQVRVWETQYKFLDHVM